MATPLSYGVRTRATSRSMAASAPRRRVDCSSRSRSSRRGRRGTPAETALRMLVLKHLRKWSYEQLEWEVTGNIVYRYFCRIDGGKVPDAKTMVRIGLLLDGDVLKSLFS